MTKFTWRSKHPSLETLHLFGQGTSVIITTLHAVSDVYTSNRRRQADPVDSKVCGSAQTHIISGHKLHLSCVRATSHCAANGRRHFYYLTRGMFRCHHHPDWRPLVSTGCRGRQFSIITSIGRSWGLSVRVSEWLLSVVCSRVWFLGQTFWLQAL